MDTQKLKMNVFFGHCRIIKKRNYNCIDKVVVVVVEEEGEERA